MSSEQMLAVDVEECAREPIHSPGAIQPHGLLLVMRQADLVITQVSANLSSFVDIEATDAPGKPVGELLDPDFRLRIEDWLNDADVGFANPLRISLASGRVFDGIVHRQSGLILLELENERSGGFADPKAGVIDPYFAAVERSLGSSVDIDTVQEMAEVIVRDARALTGFDRVMVYRFDDDGSGVVVAEAKAEDMEPFLDLRYPATDVPEQARALYVRNQIRTIVDVEYEAVPLLPEIDPTTAAPLDISSLALRSVSPVHLQDLRNMGVASSASISLVRGDQLWGLTACHHRTPKLLSYATRAACVVYGKVMSAQLLSIEAADYERRRSARREIHARLVNALACDADLVVALRQHEPDLLQLVEASGAALCYASRYEFFGDVPPTSTIRAIHQWLVAERQQLDVWASDRLAEELPAVAGLKSSAAGLLAIPLGIEDFLLFFRPEVRHTVRWGGNPTLTETQADATAPLSPRASFEVWEEQIRGRSLRWTRTEIQAAKAFHHSLVVLILGQGREMSRINRQLSARTEEIEQFVYTVSHDLRSPLVTCQGFLGLMRGDLERGDIESALDSADEIQTASNLMGRIIDDLLALSRLGRGTQEIRQVDVQLMVEDLITRYRLAAEACGATLRIEGELPPVVTHGEYLDRALDNLISNALKYARGQGEEGGASEIVVGCVEKGKEVHYFVQDSGPGIDPAYHETIFGIFQRLESDKPGSGIGLASVAKIMQILDGRCWVESELGAGATFWLALPRSVL